LCYLVGVGSRWAKVLVECLAGECPRRARQRPRPLEAFRELIKRRKRSIKRIVRLRLFPNRYEDKVLFDIGLACARLWNELNYEKRQAFFNRELTIMKRDEINRRYYHKYKGVLGVNAGQVINKNDGAWDAFFKQLDLRK